MSKSGMPASVVLRSPKDVRSFIDTQPQARNSLLIVLIALGGVFVDAYDFTSLGIGVVQLRSQFHLSPFETGSVTAMMAFGAFVGALWGGYFTDKVGRFKMFLLDLVFLVIAAIGAALSVNLVMLLFFRFLMGLGVGLDFPVALSFISEFVAERRRGGSVNLWQVMWYVAASCTGLVVLPFYLAGAGADLWRIAVGFGAVPALIILLLRTRYMNESPQWAAHNVGLEEAGRIIERTYGVSVKVEQERNFEEKQNIKISFSEIFSKLYISRTTLVSIICATQSLAYFAVGFNLPTISTKLFGHNFIFAILGAILFNCFGIIGGFFAVKLTWKLGVRRLTIIGYALVIVSLVVLYAGGSKLSLTATSLLIGLFIFGHAFGPGAQGMTMAALSYPTRIRGVGTGWGQSMVRIGSILGFYFFPLLVAAIGFRSMMLALAVIPLLGLIAAIVIRWEPVGQDLDLADELEICVVD